MLIKAITVTTTYQINERTLVLLPAYHLDYQTIVYEKNQRLLIDQSPLNLIKAACIDGGATYQGRKDAVKQLFNIRQKVPIPIQPHRNIYAFPTESPTNHSCKWVFPLHIQTYSNDEDGVTLNFNKDTIIPIGISLHKLHRQLNYTYMCSMHLKPR